MLKRLLGPLHPRLGGGGRCQRPAGQRRPLSVQHRAAGRTQQDGEGRRRGSCAPRQAPGYWPVSVQEEPQPTAYLACYMKEPINPKERISGTSGFVRIELGQRIHIRIRIHTDTISYNDIIGYGPSTNKRIP